MKPVKKIIFLITILYTCLCYGQEVRNERIYNTVLKSKDGHKGEFVWKMKKAGELSGKAEDISTSGVPMDDWMPAVVPGTVLNSLVYNKIYPEPYYGLNNKLESNLIPDLYHTGRDFYTYWFRTEFDTPAENYKNKKTWLQVDGINYRAELWLNGNMVGNIAGMFYQDHIDISDYILFDQKNVLAVKVYPIDVPGTIKPKGKKAIGALNNEFQNGGNGEIGKNVTQLMTVGWDFTFLDGIRDRNTGIWKDISVYTTGNVALRHPFVKSDLSKPGYDLSKQTISVEVINPNANWTVQEVTVRGEIKGENITFEKQIQLIRGQKKEIIFTPEEYPQLVIKNPRLWWPINKGEQELYDLALTVTDKGGNVLDSISSRFGIREITSDTNTPDKSRTFYVNGKPIFIRGTNWLPENMLRNSEERTYAELRYTAQAGINLIRFWGGGITESDYFFQLCDELGIMVWTEFWMTGDTKHPVDESIYYNNVISTVKRIRNHPSLAYYVSSNESTEMPETEELIQNLDGTRGYQMQSECCGVHDGSPYKQVNIMCHYENTASDRGSRVDGFNPEYGAPCLPTVECLREMMDEKDLWPINKEVWDYSDGNGFHLMTTMYTDMVNEYGESKSIDEFAEKGQLVGAFNYKSIWEVWNYNKLGWGDRYCSGFLFWYHNPPIRQVCARMWDWSLEPTAALYATQNACEPLHPQFDYLKNTVSVINDYYRAFNNYKILAEIYDLNSRKVFSKEAVVNLPENGTAKDLFKIDFPVNISNVHFIKLRLFDDKGKEVGSNFYWRSNNKYEGRKTLTGPTTAGFEDLSELKQTQLKVNYKTRKEQDRYFVEIDLRNTSGTIAFFTQLQFLDSNNKPIRPSFYTDNFFSLLPGERKSITIETNTSKLPVDRILVVKGWNIKKEVYSLK
ncbi:glycoside hydrolase family 2 protein [Parabacteroides sp. Marseille-P3160]|uniref:glycoside hydrolase family 2 protein n=1 Tax=Parabacteroides sp. Marseille-P3160 TaxID=1917887 RepID=UPI0009BA036A|nr:glycoside hydrolase family 2 protein [Parabacteroides sp. Marseille-P3160]